MDCGVVVNAQRSHDHSRFAIHCRQRVRSSLPNNYYAGLGKGTISVRHLESPGNRVRDTFCCDGRARVLSTSLAMSVYVTLMSSGGSHLGQTPIGDNY